MDAQHRESFRFLDEFALALLAILFNNLFP
jgi:hypothetical protein